VAQVTRRLALAGVALVAGTLAVGALQASRARPASADVLPSPLPTLPLPLPSLTPVPLPLPTPVAPTVDGVVKSVPAQSTRPAPAPSGGASAGAAGTGGGGQATTGPPSADPPEAPPYQPPPAEQAALPPEPQRFALEGQQAWLAGGASDLDRQDGPAALLVGGGDGRFTWPVAFRGHPPITQRFGCTDVPGEPYSAECATHRFHTGIDLGVHAGTPVYASAAGVAHVYRSDSGYGNHVLVAHGNGWFTLYAHLGRFTVHEGEAVRRGDPVGLSGSTGFSTGPHLHFEIRYGQRYQEPCVYLGC
jgi:Peptidase family M23